MTANRAAKPTEPQTGETPPTRSWPTSMPELLTAEQLVIWSLRTQLKSELAGSQSVDDGLDRAFERQFGPSHAYRGLSAFADFYRQLRTAAMRALHFHQPICPGLAADEVCLLTMLTACQHGEDRLAAMLAEMVAHPSCTAALLRTAQDLASVMDEAGLHLPQRSAQPGRHRQAPWFPISSTRH